MHGEKMSSDESSASKFKDKLKRYLDEEGYDEDFIYNADETGLKWKTLPKRTLASRAEDASAGCKASKGVTVMICANSSGTHSIPLLVIGKSKKPKCFKHAKNLPVVYRSQKKAWMNGVIFMGWFENTFIPEVKKFQHLTGKSGNVLLLTDNAPPHPSTQSLNSVDETVEVIFLPPNVIPLRQPMDQGVIENLKRLYRKQILRHLLLTKDRSVQSVLDFYKTIILKDCCYMIADSWSSIKQFTLRNSWNNIFVHRKLNATPGLGNTDMEMKELLDGLKAVSLSSECEEADAEMWLSCDRDDPGFQIFGDDEIIEAVSNVDNEMDEDTDIGECCVRKSCLRQDTT
uniref:DDE-1 domain-containing protein n=1 Tax=Trichuris muris TaxID=70415 RepID=A0A5S6QSY9_TRIMR